MAKPKPKLIKVRLTNRGAASETPWAHDLGPVRGGRKVRLANVPFMHAKPTWGDVVIVEQSGDDDFPTWDRDGVPWAEVGTRILEDGGHWAMIVDYRPHDDVSSNDAFRALAQASAEHHIVCEGAFAPRDDRPGRAYLAVPDKLTDVSVMAKLREHALPCELVQVHPTPVKRSTSKPAAKPARTKRAAKKPAKKPARAMRRA